MSEQSAYPYATHLNILYEPLQVVDVQALVDACKDRWYNQTLTRVNDAVVRLGVLEGEYHWHKHEHEDEFFYVVDGRFLIDLEERTTPRGTVKPCRGSSSIVRSSRSIRKRPSTT